MAKTVYEKGNARRRLPFISLTRLKFELTNQDSAGGETLLS